MEMSKNKFKILVKNKNWYLKSKNFKTGNE